MIVIRAVYMSRPSKAAFQPNFGKTVDAISRQSHANNKRLGLTGALIVHEDWFIQVLEGEREKLTPIFTKIMCDKRHDDMRVFEITTVPERMFKDWAMHVGYLSDLEPRMVWECIDGFNRYGPRRSQVLIQALTASAMLSVA